MSITARSVPNIALIKYWGNRNDALRLPAADSLSMTLDGPTVEIAVEESEVFSVDADAKDLPRFKKHFELTKNYLGELVGAFRHGSGQASHALPLPASVSVSIHSSIPRGVGLASSAAVFSALAKAYAELASSPLTNEQVSVIARLGSGSAARSIFSGFVALEAGAGDDVGSSKATQIADENHWPLHDIIIVPSQDEKKVGSTEGHALAHTSPFFEGRIDAIQSYRQKECTDAILQKDFEKLQKISEEDCMDMHHVMETSAPPLRYLTEDTLRIISDIKAFRESEHIPVLFTMDAGPTVHLVCTDEARERVLEFAHVQVNVQSNVQKGCTVFETSVGSAARIISSPKLTHAVA